MPYNNYKRISSMISGGYGALRFIEICKIKIVWVVELLCVQLKNLQAGKEDL